MATVEQVKEFQLRTGVDVATARKWLFAAETDSSAILVGSALVDVGIAMMPKPGVVHAYAHTGSQVSAMVDLRCGKISTVEDVRFLALAQDMLLHIVACSPRFVQEAEMYFIRADGTPDRESFVQRADMKAQTDIKQAVVNDPRNSRKPEDIIAKIVDGKWAKYVAEQCLLTQSFVKDPKTSIERLIAEAALAIDDDITVKAFSRFEIEKP